MKNGNPERSTVTSAEIPRFSDMHGRAPPGSSTGLIRARLHAHGVRCFANDAIGEHLSADDLAAVEHHAEECIRDLLSALLIDTDADHNSRDTPARMARMFVRELFAGRYNARPTVADFPNTKGMHELYTVGPITVRSTCAHHMCPIEGKAWCAVVPGDRLIGLSKFNRLCDWVLSRPQIQEEAVTQIADEIESSIRPLGLTVVVRAKHSCMTWRGVREHLDAAMTTMVTRGSLANDDARRNVLELIKGSGF